MPFKMSKMWLMEYYGSAPNQVDQAREWLLKYGREFTPVDKIDEWSKWKHLIEYSSNTNDIVDQCLAQIGNEFESELEAHRFINLLRVPLASSYEEALKIINPSVILELGVGGDSAISTSLFLRWVEKKQGQLDSVDINPLGMTWRRYSPFTDIWTFTQADALKILSQCSDNGSFYDLIFIDTSHDFYPTLAELEFASRCSDSVLLDDALFEGNPGASEAGGVKRAIKEWLNHNLSWKKSDFWNGEVVLLQKIKG